MWSNEYKFKTRRSIEKIYELAILRKLGLSVNFPRAVLYSRKTVLSVGLLAPRMVIDALAMKLYVAHQQLDNRINKIIQIIEDNTRIQYGYSKSIIEVERDMKSNKITWSDEIQERLSRRGLSIENRVNGPEIFTENKTIMEMVVDYTNKSNIIISLLL